MEGVAEKIKGEAQMIDGLTEWLPIYNALITSGLLVAVIVLLRYIVKSKNATIETLREQVRWWESQSSKAVHELNEALRKEIEELRRNAEKERTEKEAENTQLRKQLKEYQEAAERGDYSFLKSQDWEHLVEAAYAPSRTPSGVAADSLERVSKRIYFDFPMETRFGKKYMF